MRKKGLRGQRERVRRVVTPGVEITGDGVGVQIIGGRDIVVSNPDAGFSITYRKDGAPPGSSLSAASTDHQSHLE